MTEPSTPASGEIDRIGRKHIDLVYAAALRRLHGDPHRAADVTQAVMLVLLRKTQAGKLPKEKYMAGWLIKVTGYAVMQLNRSATRRTHHESVAARAMPRPSTDNTLNADIREALDESLLKLNAIDREVIIRRCLQDQSLAEIGQTLGMSENTVGKRIVRAIPKLRELLQKRGITASTAAIAAVLAVELAAKAPASAATTSVITPAISQLAKKVAWRIAMIKLKTTAVIGVAILILAGAGTTYLVSTNRAPSTAVAANPPQLVWSIPPSIDVAAIIDGPSDALLKELLAGLQQNRDKIHLIHVHAIDGDRIFDPKTKTWNDPMTTTGETWLEAGDDRRFRAEIVKGQSRVMNLGKLGPIRNSSYTETWDGKTTVREYHLPFSDPQGETFPRRYIKTSTLTGSDFSMQMAWDEETSADQKGTHIDIYRNPLDPAVLATMKLSAQRVRLTTGPTATTATMELTVNHSDSQMQRAETFWFDPQRGYALLARRNTISILNQVEMKQTYIIQELTEAAPGIFYPSKAQMLWESHGEPFIWQNYSAAEVKANEPADANLFTLQFSAGIEIYDYNADSIGTKRKPAITP